MKPNASSDLPRAALQLLAIGALIGGSFLILRPFLGSLIWAIAIVVATWPVLLQLEALLGGRRSLAVSLMTAVLVLLVALPIYFGIGAIVANAQRIAGWTEALATAKLPEPPAWLASIPLLGEKLAALWRQVADASSDELVAHLAPYGQDLVKWFVSQIGSAGTLFVQLLLTVVLCGILYANGDAASVAARFCQ